MYLILLKDREYLGKGKDTHLYTSIFTDSILDVAQAFRDAPNRVTIYRIDTLTEIKEIEIQIQEKTKEMV